MQAYFDCFSGISGDMTLGALIDLGAPVDWLQKELSRLPLNGFQLTATPVMRNGIRATFASVEIENSDHSRDYKTIKSLLESCPLSDAVKSRSLTIFERLALAEAGIHGCALYEVHFHEVGGVDALVDIVGTALCLEKLEINQVISSRIPLGSGFVDCQHGKLPLPAPATVEILKDVTVYGTDVACELVTPTGAAIITSLAESFGPLPPMRVEKIGYGAGQRELADSPNLLRII
ncbi:MAG: LarC family nickel insertion protein, partial [Desulfobacterales bacterium]|nr:LarC family nickel insertion protein [Desulfobacterales bacterium]